MTAAEQLDALCARGPWNVRGAWRDSLTLTSDEVRACYAAIRDGGNYALALGTVNRSDRRVNRAVQLLWAAGLIEYTGKPKRWKVTS